jgi:hypothetical protein
VPDLLGISDELAICNAAFLPLQMEDEWDTTIINREIAEPDIDNATSKPSCSQTWYIRIAESDIDRSSQVKDGREIGAKTNRYWSNQTVAGADDIL